MADNPTIYSLPQGMRDVLPDEMVEVRRITESLSSTFRAAQYGEVYTPTLEYESVLDQNGAPVPNPAHRLFDANGNVLVMRSDLTVPIARVAATRLQDRQPPHRLFYIAEVFRNRSVYSQSSKETLQAGIELIGLPSPQGTAEVLELLSKALTNLGLKSYRIGVGDAGLYRTLLESFNVPLSAQDKIIYELVTRDFVGIEREVMALTVSAEHKRLLIEVPRRRGGLEILNDVEPEIQSTIDRMKSVVEGLSEATKERVILDLGLVRDLDYYTGAVFEVYDPEVGTPIGGGGRYDELVGCFGRDLPAVGFGLYVEQLHAALYGEEVM